MARSWSSEHDDSVVAAPGLFSIVIPARDEAKNLQIVIPTLLTELERAGINHEILVVNDGSTDETHHVLVELATRYPNVRFVDNPPPNGFGLAVRTGLANFRGDAVAIVMADGSDDPADLVKYYVKLQDGFDCVFGSRFIAGGKLIDYPAHKLIINRFVNLFIKVLFQIRYNDVTNAFKCYRRTTIAGLKPILAHHFNLTVELPLKAIIRGYSYVVIPISWTNRTSGVSRLRIREMGSRYLFIVLYCFIERLLSRGDYRRKPVSDSSPEMPAPLLAIQGARSTEILTALLIVIACLAIAYFNASIIFVDWTVPTSDFASNDILVADAKRLALFHGHYSRASFYHPGPFYFQWMAIFEWLFMDTLRMFVSPFGGEIFSVAVLHILAFALYFRLWLLWTGNVGLAVAALLITTAVLFAVTGNYIGIPWPPYLYMASTLMTVTGLIGMTARGPSWLPLFVFGLAQLVHGHASFIGLAPLMAFTAVVVAWIGGRLPPGLWRVVNLISYAKAHPRAFQLSIAIAVVFALPILINTIVAWPGELPKYFQFAARQSNRIGDAILYVVSFVPLKGLWALIFLFPAKHSEVSPSPADFRFAGLLVLLVGGVPAIFYARHGVDDFRYPYLMFWMLPFVGAALVFAILYFVSFLSSAWVRAIIVAAAVIVSFRAYSVIRPIAPEIRRTEVTTAAFDVLAKRTTQGEKIALKIDPDPEKHLWATAVSLIALMNRNSKNFLCVEPSSWFLVFHERYLCNQFDKISEMLNVVPKSALRSDPIAELPDAEIVALRKPIVGTIIRFSKLDDVAAMLWGFSETEAWGNWSDGANATLAFDASDLPKKFSVLIQARLFSPTIQSVRLTGDNGREIAMLTSASAQPMKIELTRPTVGHFITLNFGISHPVAPSDSGGVDTRHLGIGLEQVSFENTDD